MLALSREHVRLRKPLERRISEPACKHCGRQKEWRMPMAVLHRKGGSGPTLRELHRLVLAIAEEDEEYRHMPDYQNCIEDVKVQLVARSRGTLGDDRSDAVEIPALDPESYDMARAAAPGWDVHVIEAECRAWASAVPRNPEMAFLGFCKKGAQQRGEG